MNLTNKFGLPDIFVRAIENDKYDKGKCDFSATELIAPARQRRLLELSRSDLVVDVSTRIDSALGTGWHSFIERGARAGIDTIERRFFANYGGHVVSSQIDLFESDSGRLIDYKTCKVYAVMAGDKIDWQAQLNIGADILRENGLEVNSLHICAIIKDWDYKCADPSNTRWFKPKYPKVGMKLIDIEMWPATKAKEFIHARIEAHESAKKHLPKCSAEETWSGRRCERWCDVNKVCTQYAEMLKTGLIGGSDEV